MKNFLNCSLFQQEQYRWISRIVMPTHGWQPTQNSLIHNLLLQRSAELWVHEMHYGHCMLSMVATCEIGQLLSKNFTKMSWTIISLSEKNLTRIPKKPLVGAKYHHLKPPLNSHYTQDKQQTLNIDPKTTKYTHAITISPIYNEIWIFKKVCTEIDDAKIISF